MPGPTATDRGARNPAAIRVLLVEDDEGDAFLVRELLADATDLVTLERVASVAAARPVVAGFDCVVLDLGLPDSTGLEGLRRFLAIAARVPVVVLTGFHDETLGMAAVAQGAQDYLVKGQVSGALLERTIRYALQRRRAEDAETALLAERLRAAENVRLERGLLPRPLVRAADVTVTSRYLPGGGRSLLGGDFYDVVQDADGAIHAIIGDVAGHGPDQAALGVALRIAWRTLVLAGRPHDEILRILDQVLIHERHDDVIFATVCALRIAPDHRSAGLYLAGHPAPLLYGGDAWSPLPQRSGPAFGLVKDARYTRIEVPLPAQPFGLLLYTDGVIEGYTGVADGRLGTEGLLRLLNRSGRPPGDGSGHGGLLDDAIAEVTRRNGGPLTDDLALLLLSFDH